MWTIRITRMVALQKDDMNRQAPRVRVRLTWSAQGVSIRADQNVKKLDAGLACSEISSGGGRTRAWTADAHKEQFGWLV
ncbi:hypothetical protein FIBSPDRAFT_497536 [Athelia psychrophila]|uniref:Uncharacterized protein n=1 Tax=Athelia psychrophila TaxID=1759441 RepID=A0A166KE91_9AGAM|nr:hypothetical protein FIBSPDRAFT_497536 [Fibularhizoctonia sp. CBS 109695]